jgi:hypothetical protein
MVKVMIKICNGNGNGKKIMVKRVTVRLMVKRFTIAPLLLPFYRIFPGKFYHFTISVTSLPVGASDDDEDMDVVVV